MVMEMATAIAATSKALDVAINQLENAPVDPHALAAAARNVTRIADEAELTAWETSDRDQRAVLLNQVQTARVAAHTARQTARHYSLTASRDALLGDIASDGRIGPHGRDSNEAGCKNEPPGFPSAYTKSTRNEGKSETVRLAHDINDTLRRTTAVVADEVARSRAAGAVVDDSSRVLSRTHDRHVNIGTSLRDGGKTLRRLRTSEALANAVVVISFAIFFLTAGYVASRRLRSSFIASVVVRPAASIVYYPVAALVRGGARLGRAVRDSRGIQGELHPINTITPIPLSKSPDETLGPIGSVGQKDKIGEPPYDLDEAAKSESQLNREGKPNENAHPKNDNENVQAPSNLDRTEFSQSSDGKQAPKEAIKPNHEGSERKNDDERLASDKREIPATILKSQEKRLPHNSEDNDINFNLKEVDSRFQEGRKGMEADSDSFTDDQAGIARNSHGQHSPRSRGSNTDEEL